MDTNVFIHMNHNSPTTLSEIVRVHGWVGEGNFFGAYAYATQSGVSSFDIAVGGGFWAGTPSRWLFSLDYGRTQPKALRSMCEKANAEVRIVDGRWTVEQAGFVPRRDFHSKAAVLLNSQARRYGMVVGSGNFSSNGLRRSIEAGASLCSDEQQEYEGTIAPCFDFLRSLWEEATPAVELLDVYEERWFSDFGGVDEADLGAVDEFSAADLFWIEAGYVTRNRGPFRPGNQIDFPRGFSRYFGLVPAASLTANSVIGRVLFETPVGDSVENNLRLGNNMMEKISLPIPETHGFDIYDGKVLIFQRHGDRFLMRALEADDFQSTFGHRLANIRLMGSGRRYGLIV
ncbi:MAG: hypothetical protein KDK08_11905 [Rhizobiaceae bacterium]|nr:hypothetical protein [Rhizobiaceae bacterium]